MVHGAGSGRSEFAVQRVERSAHRRSVVGSSRMKVGPVDIAFSEHPAVGYGVEGAAAGHDDVAQLGAIDELVDHVEKHFFVADLHGGREIAFASANWFFTFARRAKLLCQGLTPELGHRNVPVYDVLEGTVEPVMAEVVQIQAKSAARSVLDQSLHQTRKPVFSVGGEPHDLVLFAIL